MTAAFTLGQDGRSIFKEPVETKNPDGGSNIAMGFKVATVAEYIDKPESVVALLNLGDSAQEEIAVRDKLIDEAGKLAVDQDARIKHMEQVMRLLKASLEEWNLEDAIDELQLLTAALDGYGCESCEYTGCVEVEPDSADFHPCDTCQPEKFAQWQRQKNSTGGWP